MTKRKRRRPPAAKAKGAGGAAPPKAAAYGYIRVSDENQVKSGLGLKAQTRDIDDYFSGLLKRKCRWAGVYADEATSASKVPFARRPKGAELLDRLLSGDHLIIAKLDRAFRDTLDLAQTLKRLEERGVTVHLLDIRVDTSTACGRLIVDVVGAVAAWEAKRIGERIRAAKREQRAELRATNSHRWLGYRLVRGRHVPDPRERRVMGQIVKLRRAGLLWREIAAEMRRRGKRLSKQQCWRLYDRELALRRREWPPA